MKKKGISKGMTKGMTLVEVIVATVIFMITFAAVCSTYLLAVNGEKKQRVYIHFETICKDINLYSEEFNRNWVNKYFNITHDSTLDTFSLYFDSNYNLVNLENSHYTMAIEYKDVSDYFDSSKYQNGSTTHLEMVMNIKDNKTEKLIIDNLVYGSRGGRFEKA